MKINWRTYSPLIILYSREKRLYINNCYGRERENIMNTFTTTIIDNKDKTNGYSNIIRIDIDELNIKGEINPAHIGMCAKYSPTNMKKYSQEQIELKKTIFDINNRYHLIRALVSGDAFFENNVKKNSDNRNVLNLIRDLQNTITITYSNIKIPSIATEMINELDTTLHIINKY